MVTRLLFLGFVAALGLQRLFELRLSQRNEQRMRRRGGREHAPETYRRIVALHTAWFAAMLFEVFAGRRRFHPRLAALALSLFAAGQGLRLAAIRTLGPRWSTRIMTVPADPRVRRGIYRHVRHPNYLGVELEIVSAPLVHSAWLTSAVFGAANLLLLRDRIHREEQALDEEDYAWQEARGLQHEVDDGLMPLRESPDLSYNTIDRSDWPEHGSASGL